MSGNLRVAAVALCAVTAACESAFQPLPDPESRILVHAVLDLGAVNQFVLLEHSHGPPYGVQALVTMTTPPGDVVQGEDTEACCPPRHVFQNLRLVPGGTYGLHVAILGGDTITGTTTIPFATPAASPSFVGLFNRQTDTLRLAWQRVAGAKSFHVSVYSQVVRDGETRTSTYSVFADTAVAIAGTARSFDSDIVFPVGARIRVVVAAVDDNYYTYFHAQADPFAGAPPSRLTGGALGVFGSVVPVIIRLYDVR